MVNPTLKLVFQRKKLFDIAYVWIPANTWQYTRAIRAMRLP